MNDLETAQRFGAFMTAERDALQKKLDQVTQSFCNHHSTAQITAALSMCPVCCREHEAALQRALTKQQSDDADDLRHMANIAEEMTKQRDAAKTDNAELLARLEQRARDFSAADAHRIHSIQELKADNEWLCGKLEAVCTPLVLAHITEQREQRAEQQRQQQPPSLDKFTTALHKSRHAISATLQHLVDHDSVGFFEHPHIIDALHQALRLINAAQAERAPEG